MDGLEFERFVAERMEGFGWEARCTPGSSDYGADVICTLGSEKLVIQCKCYSSSNSVGGDAVREAYTAMAHFKADHGTVVYRGRPSRQARNLSGTTGVGLYHVDELIEGWAFDRTKEGEKARRLARILQNPCKHSGG